ncbi:MAG: hypothetical protein J1E34_09100, partial [Oscillospiraceae bacterium]|nr:hypothetical protein [Oscillospiraceae bacterium]
EICPAGNGDGVIESGHAAFLCGNESIVKISPIMPKIAKVKVNISAYANSSPFLLFSNRFFGNCPLLKNRRLSRLPFYLQLSETPLG